MPRFVRAPLIGVAILTAGALVHVWAFPDEVTCAARVPLKVVSSTEKSDLLGELATDYNKAERPPGSTCAQVSVVPVSSGIAEGILAGDPDHDPVITDADRADVKGAQVWTPSSAFWLDRLYADSGGRTSFRRLKLHSLARSPLVLAMPAALEHDLGWDAQPPTWRAAMDALRAGKLNYTQENPRASTSGAMATYLTYAAGAADAAGRLPLADLTEERVAGLGGFVRDVQQAANGGFQNDSTDILRVWSRRLPERTMIMIQEQMVEGYNAGAYATFVGEKPEIIRPATPLVAVHPVAPGSATRESIVADHPYVTLPGVSTTVAAAAEDFRLYVMEHWDRLCTAGFQSPVGSDPADCAVAKHIAADVQSLTLPDSKVQSIMAGAWWTMRSTRRITIAMDVSGSMQDTRLAEAAGAVRQAVEGLRDQDEVEIYRFAGTAQYTNPYWLLRPLGSKSADLGPITTPPAKGAAKFTAVYRTVDDLYREVSRRHRESGDNTLDVLIVLSDGIQDWNPKDHTTATSVCAGWRRAKLTPVPVYTIHYDPADNIYPPARAEAGREALGQFAGCSGAPGSTKQSTGKSPLKTVFSQVMGSL